MSFGLLTVIFLTTGFLTGIFAGMLGIGGGIIFVPLLYFLLPFTPVDKTQISYIVIGTSLFCAAISSTSSGLNHFFRKNTDTTKAIYFAAGSVITAIASSFIVIKVKPVFLQAIFAVVFVLIAVKMLTEKNGGRSSVKKDGLRLKDYYGVLFGALVGVFIAFTGLGGGILFVPILAYMFGVEFKKSIGTSSMIISATGIAASIAYAFHRPEGIAAPFQFGYVYLIAGLPLALGAAAGAYYGVKIVIGSQVKSIKKVFSALLIIAVLKILFNL